MPQPFTLAERRARLKTMLKSTGPINMEAYREAICGATEEERASLARTVQPAKILGSEREAAQAPETLTSLGFYLLGALTSSPATAIRTWCTVGYISRTRCSADTHSEHLGWFIAGLTERSDEWVLQLAAVEHDPWTEAQDVWEPVHTVLRNRHLVSESPAYLELLTHMIPPMRANEEAFKRYNPHKLTIEEFFRSDPLLLEHDFWALFRGEGLLRGRLGQRDAAIAFMRYMCERFEGVRERALEETLRALLRDFSAANSAIFGHLHRALQPSREEILGLFQLYVSVLGAAPSPSVSLAQDMLNTAVDEASGEQALAVVDASAAVLFRTEKKVLRAQLRLLTKLVKAHPEYAAQVSTLVADAVESMPLDVQPGARKLIAPATVSTSTVEGIDKGITDAGKTAVSIHIPDIAPQKQEPVGFFAPRAPITDDHEFQRLFCDGYDGADIPRMLAYLMQHPVVELGPEALAPHQLMQGFKTGPRDADPGAYMRYLTMWPHLKDADNYKAPVLKFQKYEKTKHHPLSSRPADVLVQQFKWVHAHQTEQQPVVEGSQELWPYRTELIALITEPLPAENYEWARSWAVFQHISAWIWLDAKKVPGGRLPQWRQVFYPHAAPEKSPFAWRVLNVHRVAGEYQRRIEEAQYGTGMELVVQWYAWLTQNTPDVLAAQFAPACFAAVYETQSAGAEVQVLRALADTHSVLGAPSYCAIAACASARQEQVRAHAAECIAALAGRGMLDPDAFSAELSWLLSHQYVQAQRLVRTLTDAASISPLAGWRVCQVLQGLLPVVGELNRGGALVQLLAQLAQQYGAIINIPECLQPKMKGSTVLAKNLRALSALSPHPTELARQAQEQTFTILKTNPS